MTTREYKNLKGLKKENLRDNMSTLELVLNMLVEATTTELAQMKSKAANLFSVHRNHRVATGIDGNYAAVNCHVPIFPTLGDFCFGIEDLFATPRHHVQIAGAEVASHSVYSHGGGVDLGDVVGECG